MLVLVAALLAIAVATPVVAFAHDDDDDGDDSAKVVRQHRDGDDDDGDREHKGKNKGKDETRKDDEVRASLSALASATPTFRPLVLKGENEIAPPPAPAAQPPKDARARGFVILDLTRAPDGSDAGTDPDIISGKVIFTFNYRFPLAAGDADGITVVGLHVHRADPGTDPKHENGPIVIDSGITSVPDLDGAGNVTAVVNVADAALLQAILDNPRRYYVNLHTGDNPTGSLRAQLRPPKAI